MYIIILLCLALQHQAIDMKWINVVEAGLLDYMLFLPVKIQYSEICVCFFEILGDQT